MTATNLKGIFIDITILSNKDINPTEKLVLSLISIMPDGLQMTNQAIADLLNISKSRVSHIVSKLVKLNLVDIQLIYRKDMQVDKRILTIKKAVQETIAVVKKVIDTAKSKAKELKQAYTATKMTVGTQEVDQLVFSQPQYTKPITGQNRTQNTTQKRKGNIHAPMCSHNIDWNALGELEQERNYRIEE